jgi:hypothetical protein
MAVSHGGIIQIKELACMGYEIEFFIDAVKSKRSKHKMWNLSVVS